MVTTFFVPGVPVPQGSMRAIAGKDGRVHVFSANRNLHQWRDDVALIARAAHHGAPYTDAVAVRLTFVLPRPARTKRSYPSVRPDIDKLCRSVFDSCTDAGVWLDDAQVVALHARKVYGAQPGVRVSVRAVPPAVPSDPL